MTPIPPPTAPSQDVLAAVLNSWHRHNRVLVNLLALVPPGGLGARATASSPTVAEMFTHMHHERMISVHEEAPEVGPKVPDAEWVAEPDPARIAGLLEESARAVRQAVLGRIEAGRGLERNFAHPVDLIQFLIFHEGYHHGQIKLALKIAGRPIPDAVAGPPIWHTWRER